MAVVSSKSLFIFSGEPSGDLHGSHLIKALKQLEPTLSIHGIAGPRMRLEGVTGPLVMEDFSVMGLTDVLRVLPKLFRSFYLIRDYILKNKPTAVVLIDYPGFNLRLAKSLRRKGYSGKIVQYVSPTVWAWGKKRIDIMANSLDLLLTIYPFEQKYFEGTSLAVNYIGNPLAEYIKGHQYTGSWKSKLQIPTTDHLVALFPGSRPKEVEANLPLLLATANLLKQKHPEMLFGISFQEESRTLLERQIQTYQSLQGSVFLVPRQYTYELMKESRCAIAKSGTVTLELALHECPTVVFYRLSALNRFYAKYVLKLKLSHYCIVNILAEGCVFPELIETAPTVAHLGKHLENLYQNTISRDECLQSCQAIKNSLGQYASSISAAQSIFKVISC